MVQVKQKSCVTRLTLLDSAVIVGETLDTREYTFATTIMPNPTGHTDSIKNSQFKAAWQSGPTRTIRVPIALTDATLEYARQLDQGIEPRDTMNTADIEATIGNIEPRDTREMKDLPEAADLLNRLKAKRKKVGASLAEIQAILEMIEESCDDTSQEN